MFYPIILEIVINITTITVLGISVYVFCLTQSEQYV